MKLSSALIVNKLSGMFLFDLIGKVEESMQLARPLFLTPQTRPQNNGIYVGTYRKNADLPAQKIHAMLITQGRLLEETKNAFDCILNFSDDTDLSEAVNYLHSLFSIYESWLQDISDMTRQGCSLRELVDRSQAIFQNPILIHNDTFHFIAYSSFIDSSPKLSFLVDETQTSDIVNNFMIDPEYRKTFSIEEATVFPAYLTGVRSVFKNIFSHGKVVCRILIAETIRELQGSDLHFLELLSVYIRTLMLDDREEKEAPIRTLNNTLQTLLSGKQVDDYHLDRVLSSYGWSSEKAYFCVKFLVSHVDIQNHSINAMVTNLERLLPHSCAFELENDIVLYVNLSDMNRSYDEVIDLLKSSIRDLNMRAGFSLPYTGFRNCFQLLYKQAGIALDVGLRYSPYKWIHLFREISDIYLLETSTKELPANMVASAEILAMRQYDEQHHTEYFRTLKAYLNNNMQPVATAAQLTLHRTTLMYRLEKMQEKFNLNLSDPGTRLMYQLSITLLEQFSYGA